MVVSGDACLANLPNLTREILSEALAEALTWVHGEAD